MADNRVEVHISAKTSELKKGMDDAEKIVDNSSKSIETSTKNIRLSFDLSGIKQQFDRFSNDIQQKAKNIGDGVSKSFTSSFSLIKGGFLLGIGEQIARGVTEAVGALPDLVTRVGEASKELEIQARLANTTTTEFQEWAFASKKVNVEQDKLSDIMKDVNDKFGDFMQTGGGEMADFFEKIAPKVNVTAKEFQGLSGPQILEKYYQTLQKANVSQAEMTFYMESIANDATLLAPLLDNNAAKLQEYSKQAHDLGVIMDQETIAKTQEFNSALSTIQSTMQGVFTRMAGQAAPTLTQLANNFLGFAVRSKDAIDDSVSTIINIFENLLGIIRDVFAVVGDVWSGITGIFSDETDQQVGIIDWLKYSLQGISVIIAAVRAAIQIGMSLIRQVVVEVIGAVIARFIAWKTNFLMVKEAISGGLSALGSLLGTFASIAQNALTLNWAGIAASWEKGLSIAESKVTASANKIKQIAKEGADAIAENQAAVNEGRKQTITDIKNAGNLIHEAAMGNLRSPSASTPPPPTFNPNRSIGTGVKDSDGKSAKTKADADAKARQRAVDQEAKALADIRYKYATEEEKIALDLKKALSEIEKSKVTDAEKARFRIVAEKEASDKTVALRVKEFEEVKKLQDELIDNKLKNAQRSYEIDRAQIRSEFDAHKISNVQKYQLEKEAEDKLRELKRRSLEERMELENQMSSLSGKQGNQNQIMNNISDLDSEQKVADTQSKGLISAAEMQDFEDKFGGLTSRMSGLWDKGIQAMMNGTLTWKNAMNAIFSELAGAFIQSMISEPLKKYAASLATRMAIKLGFIKAETAAEVAGQAAQSGAVVASEGVKTAATATGVFARLGLKLMEVIKSIMMSAWEAMAAAWAAMSAIPVIGPVLGVAAGIAAFAGVSAIVGKVASASGGYDIPSGVNPMTQLHEEEMVLPKQHANTIRALGKAVMGDGSLAQPSMGGGIDSVALPPIYISAVDAKSIQRLLKNNGRAVASGLHQYARNFGKNGK